MFDAVTIHENIEATQTLLEMLAFRACHTPERAACLFEDESITFAELWDEINQVGGFLQSKGIEAGDRVLMIFPNGLEFFSAFYGAMRAGAIAIPIFPLSGPERILWLVQHSNARVVLVPSITPNEVLEMYQQAAQMLGVAVYRFDDLLQFQDLANTVFPVVEPDTIAFLQYTSGSTSDPKGVQLSHHNLISNVRQMYPSAPLTDQDVFISWLPVYHDLGLILMTMCPFYLGAKFVLLPTSLTHMTKWLQAITEHRGTFTAAPDIGYRMTLKQVADGSPYDLSSLRMAINAAEPVRVKTIQDFEARFNLRNVVKPAYGLAEASVGVSAWLPQDGAIRVGQHGFPSVGRPFQKVELKVVNVEGLEVPVGEIGELVLRSPAATRGYFKNPEANAKLFWKDGFLYTGDMAHQDEDGYFYIVSRRKNMIRQGGRSLAPIEIEEVVDSVPRVRHSAVIGIDRNDDAGEQAYVFVESRVPEAEASNLVREIVKSIHKALGVRPGRVYIVKPKTIPFTYNGKIQHQRLKKDYLDGVLHDEAKVIYPNY